ncbi:MAG: MBL fold metallo-hydrolase [Clostridia bacterium]|nr:MBL fold metallo-hydrolase [Clostridia bacterium]
MKIEKIVATLLGANNYVVGDDENCLIVEASADAEKIKQIVAQRNVLGIFLTHGHWDHALNIDKIQKEFNCKVFLEKNAVFKLKNKNRSFYGDVLVNSQLDENNFYFVKDNEIINLKNFKVEVIKTPGHTNCSVSYKITQNGEECLFSGDTLFCDGIGRCDLPTGSLKEMKNSLEKLFNLNENLIVLSGHGQKTTIKNEKNHIF